MIRFVQRGTFVPRLPQACVPYESFHYYGEFFLITDAPRDFVDFVVPESMLPSTLRIHIYRSFEATLTEQQAADIKLIFSHIFNTLALRVGHDLFDVVTVLPCMESTGRTAWQSTLAWVDSVVRSPTVKSLFDKLCFERDRKNEGQKLREYLISNGVTFERFMQFLVGIEIPIASYLESVPELRQAELPKGDFVAAYCALTFHQRIVERIVGPDFRRMGSGKPTFPFHVAGLLHFSCTVLIPNMIDPGVPLHEWFQRRYDQTISTSHPMMEIIPVRQQYEKVNDLFKGLSRFPQALSQGHQRIHEILKQSKDVMRDWIEGIFRRIPDDFETTKDVKLVPLEIPHLIPFPRIFGATLHLLNHLVSQVRPITAGQSLPWQLTRDCAAMLAREIGYEFTDTQLLRSALMDATYQFKQTQCLPGYERYEFLGDAVLDVCTIFPLFNADNTVSEEEMTLLKHALVSNDLWASLAQVLGLNKFVITASPSSYAPLAKPLADLVEALFGAIFLDSSLITCCRIHQLLVRRHRKLFYESVARWPRGRSVVDYMIAVPPDEFGCITRWDLQLFDHPATTESIRALLGFPIARDDLRWFQLALTHRAAGLGFSYERLEFIGDIVVKLGVTMALFCAFPAASEGGMSIVASDYKSNMRLGAAAIQLGLGAATLHPATISDQVVMRMPERLETIPKCQGDIFEAVSAAVAMTKGLHTAVNFVGRYVIGETFEHRADEPQLDPKSAALNRFSVVLKGSLLTFELWMHDSEVFAYASVGDVQLPYVARGGHRVDAERALARILLVEIEKREFVDDLLQKIEQVSRMEEETFLE
jgi:dsRNA-specific ribonuclease